MMPRAQKIALAAAAGVAVLLPVLLLVPGATPPPKPASMPAPLAAPTAPPLAHLFDRALFAPPVDVAPPPDAPQLTGIVGRLGSDAVALVRTAQGPSRTLAIGDSVDGWRLESLSIDAGLFSRGGQRVRVPLPTAEGDPAPQ